MTTKLYFVRHGESRGNLSEINLKDDRKNFLTSFGALQAQLVGQWFVKHGVNVSHVVSSDFLRARHTAVAILNQLRYDAEWTIEPRLNEFTDWAKGTVAVKAALQETVFPLLPTGNVVVVSHYYTMRAIFDHLASPENVSSAEGKKINYCQIFEWNPEEPDRVISLDGTR